MGYAMNFVHFRADMPEAMETALLSATQGEKSSIKHEGIDKMFVHDKSSPLSSLSTT